MEVLTYSDPTTEGKIKEFNGELLGFFWHYTVLRARHRFWNEDYTAVNTKEVHSLTV